MLVTGSIVLFNSNVQDIAKVLAILDKKIFIFLIDNSSDDFLKVLGNKPGIEYKHNSTNLGFGAAHNIAIKKAIDFGSQYHFIINPDVFIDNDCIIDKMVEAMEIDKNIGMMMPKILNVDGSLQYLPKLLPSPFNILWRKLRIPKKQFLKFITKYELRFAPQDKPYNVPILSGCFTLLSLNAIKKVGMYDEKFFMYFEDWDLSRRMHKRYKTIYFPKVSVYHGYESGANKNWRLFKIFFKSAIYYFNKWGWFFDFERKKINKKTLIQFN